MTLAFPHDDDDDRLWMTPILNSIDWDEITGYRRDLFQTPAFADRTANLANTYNPWEGILDKIKVNPLRESMSALLGTVNHLNHIDIDPLRESTAVMAKAVSGLNHIGVSRQLVDLWPSISASVSRDILAGIDVGAHAPALNAFSSVINQVTAGVKVTELADIIHQNFTMPDSVMETLSRRWDMFPPDTLSTALQLAMTSPEVREAAESFVEEHAEDVDELAVRVTDQGQVKVSELSNTQRLTLYKEAVNMLAQTAVTSFTAGHPVSIASQVTLSIMMFIFAIVEIEMQIREKRNQAEAEGNEIPETE